MSAMYDDVPVFISLILSVLICLDWGRKLPETFGFDVVSDQPLANVISMLKSCKQTGYIDPVALKCVRTGMTATAIQKGPVKRCFYRMKSSLLFWEMVKRSGWLVKQWLGWNIPDLSPEDTGFSSLIWCHEFQESCDFLRTFQPFGKRRRTPAGSRTTLF